ncbi:MAG: DUF1902 domain-containing protein [Thiohalocapsa sp.]
MNNTPPLFTVGVSQCDGIWTAECAALGLVTEADSLEALQARVWEIAPELADLNGLGDRESLRLHFANFAADTAEHRHAL